MNEEKKMTNAGDFGGTDDLPPTSPVSWSHGEKAKVAEKRESARLNHGEAARAYNVHRIDVRLDTEQRGYEGSLLDLSAGGAAVLATAALPVGVQVTVRLKLGERLIEARGVVKNRSKLGLRYRMGVQFTELDPENEALLQLLYGPGGNMEEADEV